ncbi:MAG: reverse transcriptase-like protein [Intrasporangium sp.]|uniref:reverse transcriptase-like protein n=1 Tax=Intrasporangium sp. TaxID=1925024 RepID=UPI0026493BED|nr:reverse transcriptase-like protein [Intrasporangium sp.]MDN5796149.1 reverse transcriptase-like protein [Intrasporangium sp.]
MTSAGRRRLVVEADGGSRGNPGVAGYGALVRDGETDAVLVELAEPLGTASNNVAEYSGLIAGLQAVLDIDPAAQVEVRMDSKLVVEQMSGRWKTKHADMRRLAGEARELTARISSSGGSVAFSWVPREQNAAADALSNEGMDGHSVHRDRGVSGLDAVDPEPLPQGGEATAQGSPQAERVGTALRLLLVQLPTDESRAAQVAAGALELLGPGTRVVAGNDPLARQVARHIARAVRADVLDSDEWAGVSGTAGADPRVTAAYRRLGEQGGTVAAVTTRRGVLSVLAEVLHLAPEQFWVVATAPGSLSAVEVRPDGTASVAFTNRTAHLR